MVRDREMQGQIAACQPSVTSMVESIIGCKWSLTILDAVRKNVVRPGEMQRFVAGISTKVLNERLAKMVLYGILVKQSFPEVPPRVEYNLTDFGERFAAILDQIEKLQTEVSAAQKDTSM